ncbi:MAG: hypothetical protein IJT16_06450 [Lachnospiraceae bacterium]|nr:hypothetical protein [Lachnospiraceae bacterium]
MAIKQFKDYANTKAYGNFQALPKGGYVARIMGATLKENRIGQYVQVAMDIAEGEYKGFFTRDYQEQTGEDKKWRCNYLLNVPVDDGSERDGWTKRRFKTFTEALEESNPGYVFDWEESKFKGLLVGALFNERQYEKNDGTIGTATNLAQVISVDKVRNGDFTLPKDKLLSGSSSTSSGDDGWMNIPDGTDEELPF